MKNDSHNLKSWLKHIESFHSEEIELGLERIKRIANKLNLLALDSQVVTIAGTNGKGSCVATLESFAIQNELAIGCYTSPHLLKFNERIRLNGKDISDNKLISAFQEIELARQSTPLTFFEFTTLVALQIFKQAELDLVVLEVGLGGRLDAVNIVEPDVSIVTTIALDHEAWLGSSLREIAFEKSGIYRKHSTNLVGDQASYDLIAKARPEFVPELLLLSSVEEEKGLISALSKLVADFRFNRYRLLSQNILLAACAFNRLFPDLFAKTDLEKMLTNIKIKGRFEQMCEQPLVIADVAHNTQAAQNLRNQIEFLNPGGKRIAICGMMADKSICDFLKVMDEVIDTWYFIGLPVDRAATAEDLGDLYVSILKNHDSSIDGKKLLNKKYHLNENLSDAYKKISGELAECRASSVSGNETIFILGSFFTVAEMCQYQHDNN